MDWTLRFASHLGYRPNDPPLYSETVGSRDPVAHVEFAAELGFAGVQYALAVNRPAAEVEKVAQALAKHRLEAGCMLYADREALLQPLWAATDPEHRALWKGHLERAFEVAQSLQVRHIAILSGADPRTPHALQLTALVENLRRAAELAQRRGMVLCLESLSRRSLPGMLLQRITEAYAVVKAVASPAVRLIFDTSHVQIMDGDLLENLRATWDALAIVQIADNPNRFEPGSGEINFETLFRTLYELGYEGLVELEHGWSSTDVRLERKTIEALRRMDQQLRESA